MDTEIVSYEESTTQESNTKSNSRRDSLISTSDIPFHGLMNRVVDSLVENPIPLPFTSMEEIQQSRDAFNNHFTFKYGTSATLISVNRAKAKIASLMRAKSKYVKGYIGEILGEADKYAAYTEFGFLHESRSYLWPTAAEVIRVSGPMMLKSLEKYGLQDRIFGTAFWKAKLEEFIVLDDQTMGEKGEVSGSTSGKNIEKAFLTQVLRSVVMVTKGMYPNTWEAELRKRGFFKERY